MLELTCDIARLTYIMDISSIMDKDVVFETKKNILEVRCFAIDKSSMLKIDIDITSFDSYKTSGFKFCIDTDIAKKFLRIFKPDDIVHLAYLEESNIIKLSCNKKYRKIELIDLSTCSIPNEIPEPDCNFICDVNAKSFIESLKVCNLSSDVIRIISTDNELQLDGFDEKSGCSINYQKIYKKYGIVESLYGSERINDICTFFPETINIKLHSKEKEHTYFPVIFTFTIRDNIGTFTYILAPRVEVE